MSDLLILDTHSVIQNLRDITTDEPFYSIWCDDDFMPQEITSQLIQYMADRDTALNNIDEYAREVHEQYAYHLKDHEEGEQLLKDLDNAVKQLGRHLFSQLYHANAYDPRGALWYEFKEFLHNDVVLKHIIPY